MSGPFVLLPGASLVGTGCGAMRCMSYGLLVGLCLPLRTGWTSIKSVLLSI